MAKETQKGWISRVLLKAGAAIQFSPASGGVSWKSGNEPEEEKKRFALPRVFDARRRLNLKIMFAKASEQSFLLNLLRGGVRGFFAVKVHSFGILFFLSGLLNVLSYFTRNAVGLAAAEPEHLLLGICEIFLAVWLALERRSVGRALKGSAFFRFVLQPVFGVESREIPDGVGNGNILWMVAAGCALGLLGFFFTPGSILLFVVIFIAAALIFHKPEAGLILYCLSLFWASDFVGGVLLGVTWVSFLLKVLLGKRSLRFGLSDLFLLPVVIWILAFSGLSFGAGFQLLLLALIYTLCGNLIRTLAWLKRVGLALAISMGLGAVSMAAGEALCFFFPYWDWQEANLFFLMRAEVSPAWLLAMVCPVALGMIRFGRVSDRVFLFFAVGLAVAVLSLVRNPFLWIAFLLGLLLFYLLSFLSALLITVIAALAGLAAFPLFPPRVVDVVLSFFGISDESWLELHNGYLHSAELFSESMPWGVGLGTEASSASGIYFEVGIAFGVVGMVLFYLLLIGFLWRSWYFAKNTAHREIHPIVLGALCGVLIFLFAGFFLPVTSGRAIALYLLLLSFPKAALQGCRREEIRLPY